MEYLLKKINELRTEKNQKSKLIALILSIVAIHYMDYRYQGELDVVSDEEYDHFSTMTISDLLQNKIISKEFAEEEIQWNQLTMRGESEDYEKGKVEEILGALLIKILNRLNEEK